MKLHLVLLSACLATSAGCERCRRVEAPESTNSSIDQNASTPAATRSPAGHQQAPADLGREKATGETMNEGLHPMSGPRAGRDPHQPPSASSSRSNDERGARMVAPHLYMGNAEIRGALDKGTVPRILLRHLPSFRRCGAGASPPTERQRVSVRFTVARSGRVVNPQVEQSTIEDHQITRCLVQAMERMVFPGPADGAAQVRIIFYRRP